MTSAVMVSWAITVVGEFDAVGRRIPDNVVQLLPMVEVVLWVKEQPQPLQVDALQAQFGLSRATAYRWLTALQDVHDPAAAREKLPDDRAPFAGRPKEAQLLRGAGDPV
ncbi:MULTISPECIES: helix-turn-helix domain-containing protein [Gammaproteobacteria]|uniref:helix-turn-helix domain-containing protein n=1 Tax=Gammaproteobacteria TaxID=1236 RepID=UPI0011131C5B|nr:MULTISPECIES: helix-turn-helix domain-containing protein [Gammaproteobacteria]